MVTQNQNNTKEVSMKELIKIQLDELYEMLPGRPAVISLRKAAEIVGMNERTLMQDGSFPLNKKNGRYYVPVVLLAKWLVRNA